MSSRPKATARKPGPVPKANRSWLERRLHAQLFNRTLYGVDHGLHWHAAIGCNFRQRLRMALFLRQRQARPPSSSPEPIAPDAPGWTNTPPAPQNAPRKTASQRRPAQSRIPERALRAKAEASSQLLDTACYSVKRHRHHSPWEQRLDQPDRLGVTPVGLGHRVDPQMVWPLRAGALQPDLPCFGVPMLIQSHRFATLRLSAPAYPSAGHCRATRLRRGSCGNRTAPDA